MIHRSARHRHAVRGFTLAEVLVATAILAVMLALFFQLVASNAKATRDARERRLAAMVAGSALERALVGEPGRDLAEAGETGGFRWRITSTGMARNARDTALPLERVRITVSRPGSDRPLIALDTLRTAR